MEKLKFRELRLGKTSAERESLEEPALLTEGFFDPDGFIVAAKKRGPFLFLGHKGSGKSAIGEHLRLTAEDDPNLFVRYISLGDFPYTSFSKIVKGDLEPEAKYPSAWSWLILLQLMDQLIKDQGCSVHTDEQLRLACVQLESAGLLPSGSLKHTIQLSIKKSAGVNWKALTLGGEANTTGGATADVPFLVEKLTRLVLKVKSESRHLIVIDGLDEIITKRNRQFESLASLVYEVDRLNAQFIRHSVPIKLIVLCRTDIYEILPNANKNKIRQDAAVELNWYHDPKEPSDSNLVRLADHRATLSAGRPIDLFAEFFPRKIKVHQSEQDVRAFLLEFTRHTPRDFITLLNYIQKASGNETVVSEGTIQSAVRSYSVEYFVPEIKDELHGYFSPEEIDRVIALLSSLGEREFTIQQLNNCAAGFNPSLDLDINDVLTHLFQCSAVGMLERSPGGHTHFTVKYRNRNAVLDLGKKLILHRGMWKALNLK